MTNRPNLNEISCLLAKPNLLLSMLYPYLNENYARISNPLYIDPSKKKSFETLVATLLDRLREKDPKARAKLTETIRFRHSNDLFLLALFSAIGPFIYTDKSSFSELNRLGSIKFKDVVISPKPNNPIYDSVLSPTRANYGAGKIRDLSSVFNYLHLFQKVAALDIEIKPLRNKKLVKLLKQRLQTDFKIAVSSFGKGLRNCYLRDSSSLKNQPVPFYCSKVAPADQAISALNRILERCKAEHIGLLILPELTVDPNLMATLAAWLREHNDPEKGLMLVVAGSFHVNSESGERFNQASVLDYRGKPCWQQNKMQRFSFGPSEKILNEMIGAPGTGGHEQITLGESLTCYDTPLGRLAVCICIDFFEKDHQETLKASGTNVFLVPAMSKRTDRFVASATMLSRDMLAATFVANHGETALKLEDGSIDSGGASFVQLPSNQDSTKYAVGADEDLLVYSFSTEVSDHGFVSN